MALPTYTGVIIGLDLASATGVAEGVPGEVPQYLTPQLRDSDDGRDLARTFGRAIGFMAERIASPRWIDGRCYGQGEAADAGLIRVVIEAPINNPMIGNTNAMAQFITKGLWACCAGLAHKRGCMVRSPTVGQVRKQFIGSGAEKGDVGKRMARMMCVGLGWPEPPTLDVADAAAVWWWGCNLWHPAAAPLTQPLFSRIRWEP